MTQGNFFRHLQAVAFGSLCWIQRSVFKFSKFVGFGRGMLSSETHCYRLDLCSAISTRPSPDVIITQSTLKTLVTYSDMHHLSVTVSSSFILSSFHTHQFIAFISTFLIRPIPEITWYVLNETLNSTRSLTHLTEQTKLITVSLQLKF